MVTIRDRSTMGAVGATTLYIPGSIRKFYRIGPIDPWVLKEIYKIDNYILVSLYFASTKNEKKKTCINVERNKLQFQICNKNHLFCKIIRLHV